VESKPAGRSCLRLIVGDSRPPAALRRNSTSLTRLVGDGARVLDGLAPLGDVALQDIGEPALRRSHHDQADLGQAFLRSAVLALTAVNCTSPASSAWIAGAPPL
jgi:hypothetical protein